MRQTPIKIALAGGFFCACSLQAAAHPGAHTHEPSSSEKSKAQPEISHVKMGASVAFKHSELDALQPGENGRVTVFVSEAYPDGRMTVTLRASEGLDVFGAERSMQFDLSNAGPHEVSISFGAETAGDYRIGVTASVELGTGQKMGRAFAVPVRIGKGGNTSVASKGSVQTDVTGERRIVFQANETIR